MTRFEFSNMLPLDWFILYQFWGDCVCARHRGTPGQNHLGRLLVGIREELAVQAA